MRAVSRVALERLDDVEAVHIRHHQVEQDQVGQQRCASVMASLPP